MSGCAVCVYDLYLESKAAYAQGLTAALGELQKQDVPKEVWPDEVIALSVRKNKSKDASVQETNDSIVWSDDDSPLDASMKAFQELERRLKAK